MDKCEKQRRNKGLNGGIYWIIFDDASAFQEVFKGEINSSLDRVRCTSSGLLIGIMKVKKRCSL